MKIWIKDLYNSSPLLSPSGPVDDLWHRLILEQPFYSQFCTLLNEKGSFYHSPSTADDPHRTVRYTFTKQLFESIFPNPELMKYWPNEEIDTFSLSEESDEVPQKKQRLEKDLEYTEILIYVKWMEGIYCKFQCLKTSLMQSVVKTICESKGTGRLCLRRGRLGIDQSRSVEENGTQDGDTLDFFPTQRGC